VKENFEKKPKEKSVFNGEIWKNKRYVIWAIAIPMALFGYFVPYVHIVTNPKNHPNILSGAIFLDEIRVN
jgi:hypothetical protein